MDRQDPNAAFLKGDRLNVSRLAANRRPCPDDAAHLSDEDAPEMELPRNRERTQTNH